MPRAHQAGFSRRSLAGVGFLKVFEVMDLVLLNQISFLWMTMHGHTGLLILISYWKMKISQMDWPMFSPDLNPIEHVWDTLGRRLAAQFHPPRNTQQLK
ncbi:hypothetical protein TNCV_4320741 [Trichonephila clavipes]|nr:hypothetical protein TNCV_4320741 [Trichonephila clavipes]